METNDSSFDSSEKEERIPTFREEFFRLLALSEDYERLVEEEERERLESRSQYFRIFEKLPIEEFLEQMEEEGVSKLEEIRFRLEDIERQMDEDDQFYWFWFVADPKGIELLDFICERDKIDPVDLQAWIWGKVREDYARRPEAYEEIISEPNYDDIEPLEPTNN